MKIKLLFLSSLFTLMCFLSAAQPPNDTFAGAIPITIPSQGAASPQFTLPFTTDGTTDSGLDNAGCSSSGNDQFFTWTATQLSLTFSSLSPGNPGIAVYDTAGNQISCANTFVTNNVQSGWAIGDDLVIQIYDFAGSSADVAFDLFIIPCPAPSALTETVTTTTADISWTNNSTSTETILEYGPAGFTAGSGTVVNVSGGATTSTISGLSPSTDYDYILTQDCTATGDGTSVAATGSFTTAATCPAPTAFAASIITDVSLDLSWTNNTGASVVSSIEYGPDGFTLGTGTVVAAGADSASISGLTPETDYDFYVTQDCSATGDGLSDVTGPLSVETACAPIAAPYFVDFENFTAATSGFDSDQCWTEISPTVYDWAIDASGGTTSSGTGPDGAFSGTTFMFVEASNGANGDIATVLSPAVDLSALTTPSISFYYHMYGAFITDLTVGVSTDNGATFTTELTITGQQQTASSDPWLQAVVDLSSYASQTVIVSFTTSKSTMTGNTYEGDVSIDDVNFDELPSCIDVSGITVDTLLPDSMTLSWTENNTPPSTAWEVVVLPSGSAAPTAGATNATTNPFTVAGLTPETAYDVYIRTDCSTTFVGPISVTTPCAVIVPDALETFDTFVPNCWDEATDGDIASGPTGLGSGDWGVEEFAHATTSGGGAVNVNLYNLGTSDWLLSPVYDLSAGGYELNVDIAVTAYNSTNPIAMGSDDQVILLYTEDGTTWNTLETWDVSNTPSNTGDRYNNLLTGLTGATTQFAFYATEGTVDDPEDLDFHVDNFEIRTIPTCPDTANLVLVSNNDVQATINFDSGNAMSAGNYEYSLTTVAGTAPSVTGAWTDVAGANPNVTYTITGLTAETEYFVHVREVCAPGDESAWTLIPLNFTTSCAPIAAPYFVDFENFTAATSGFESDQCWTEVSPTAYDWAIDASGGTGSSNTGPSGAYSGTTFMFVEASNGANGDVATVLSPAVDLTALTAPSVTFYYHMYGAFITDLVVGVSTDNGATFTTELTISGQQQTSSADAWAQAIVDLTSYAGQTVIVSFTTSKSTMAGNTYEGDVSIDDVNFDELPPCADTANLTLITATGTDATINFDSGNAMSNGNYEYAVTTAAATAPAVTGAWTDVAGANPNVTYTITGLTPETEYFVYVREVCAIGYTSAWTATALNFTTPCAALTAPYFEDFESFTATTNFTGENCWIEGSTTAFDWEVDGAGGTDSSNTGPSAAFSGSTFLVPDASDGASGDTAVLWTPAVDLSALTAPYLTFYYHMYGSAITSLEVEVSTDNGLNFTNELSIVGQQQAANSDPWSVGVVDLTSYANQTVIVRFTTVKGAGTLAFEGDVALDDVSFDELPACLNISNLAVDSFTSDEVVVSWTDNNITPSTAWEAVILPAGSAAPTAGTSNVTAVPYTFNMLMPETAYDIYVRADCATDFIGPISVTTLCAPIVPDALETFDTFVPNCWDEAENGDLTSGPTGLGSSEWFTEEFAHATTSGGGAVNVNLYNLGTSDWLLSPIYDLSAGGYELNVDVAVTAYNSTAPIAMGSDDQVILLYTEDGTTWNTLVTWDVSNTPSATGDTYNNPLTGLTGATTQFAFYATEGTVDDPEDLDFHLDNFQIRTPPSCPDTMNLTLVSNTDVEATINFDSGNATSAGNYEYSLTTVAGTAPAVSGAWTDVAGANPNVTYTITGLSPQTEYFVHVREVCAVGDEGPWSVAPLNFFTDCAAVTMFPAATDFTNNVPNACWSEAGDGEIATGPTGIGSSEWKDGRAYTNGIGTVVPSNVMNLYRQGDREWLISETYDLSSLTTKILTVEVALTDYSFSGTSTAADVGAMGSDDTVDLLITTDNGLTWTSLDTWNAANEPAVTGDRLFYDLAAYSGTVQFAFFASDGTVDDPEDFDFHVSAFVVDATAGNDDALLENEVSLYPNPVTGDSMTISLGNMAANNASVLIYNALGQEVMYRDFDNVSNNTLVVNNLSSLTTGVYLVHISNGSSTTVKRFIKK